jgi:MFS family permease
LLLALCGLRDAFVNQTSKRPSLTQLTGRCPPSSAAGVSAGYPILSSYAVVFYQDLITHNQRQALLLNAGIAVIFALANLYSASIVDKAGRRVMARSYMVGNLILLAGIAGLSVLFPEKSDRRASFVIGEEGWARWEAAYRALT